MCVCACVCVCVCVCVHVYDVCCIVMCVFTCVVHLQYRQFTAVLQDLPFLIIPGLYFIAITRPVDSVQACLLVCFIDICVYVIYIVRERRNVHLYVNWSRKELQRYYSCFFNRKTTGMSRYSPGCQHGNSEDDDNDESRRYLESKNFYTIYSI